MNFSVLHVSKASKYLGERQQNEGSATFYSPLTLDNR